MGRNLHHSGLFDPIQEGGRVMEHPNAHRTQSALWPLFPLQSLDRVAEAICDHNIMTSLVDDDGDKTPGCTS